METNLAITNRTTIKPVFLGAIKRDPALRQKLAEANLCAPFTIGTWIRDAGKPAEKRLRQKSKLMAPHNLQIVREHFGLKDTEEILEEGNGVPAN